MINRFKLWMLCGVVVAGSFCASSASGQIAFGPGGYGLGFFNYNNNQPRIPYYALYPPVYYSYPVARPYGFSPFAYPPGVMTPDVAPQPQAAEYRNPYVPSPKQPKPASDKVTTRGRMYLNPFVAQASDGSSATLAQRQKP